MSFQGLYVSSPLQNDGDDKPNRMYCHLQRNPDHLSTFIPSTRIKPDRLPIKNLLIESFIEI